MAGRVTNLFSAVTLIRRNRQAAGRGSGIEARGGGAGVIRHVICCLAQTPQTDLNVTGIGRRRPASPTSPSATDKDLH